LDFMKRIRMAELWVILSPIPAKVALESALGGSYTPRDWLHFSTFYSSSQNVKMTSATRSGHIISGDQDISEYGVSLR